MFLLETFCAALEAPQIVGATFLPPPQPPTPFHWAPVLGMELLSFGPRPVNTLPLQTHPSPSAWGHNLFPGLGSLGSSWMVGRIEGTARAKFQGSEDTEVLQMDCGLRKGHNPLLPMQKPFPAMMQKLSQPLGFHRKPSATNLKCASLLFF